MANSLSGALASLQTSTHLLQSSLSILDAGTSDLPRLSKVLTQTRHFELLPSSTIESAQADLLSELTPEVEALLARVERYVEKLERREQGLRAKWELQEGRLGREVQRRKSVGQQSRQAAPAAKSGGGAASGMDELRARQLRQKKERLSYAVERLQMQAQQTERRLRLSMAQQQKPDEEEDDFL